MDPNATLARIRELTDPGTVIGHDEGAELAELVEALDRWLTRGGPLPEAWATDTRY